ncbi:hypothetical protein CFP56_027528 [Quercus suber]|uniref:DUF2828 domain-containing protein n=1 Tax=Quercus suber TaxID=58331 RepID=A0AAW0JWI3_QUESU
MLLVRKLPKWKDEINSDSKINPTSISKTHSSILLSNNSNPSLEFFFESYSNDIFFEKTWKHDPFTTLKLIYYQRILSESDKETLYYSAHWLHQNRPLTLA